MKIIDELNSLKKLVDKKPKNISSIDVKKHIKKVYEIWLIISTEISEDFPKSYNTLHKDFETLYSFEPRHHFSKKETLKILRRTIKELDRIRVENFKQGVKFKEDYKEKVYGLLKKKEFSKVVKYLKDAETYMKKDSETSCGKSREAIEELFRVISERVQRKGISRGTLGQYSSDLKKRGLISSVEDQFFKSGVYSFLSEKGSHANTERKDEIDALFGFKLVLITVEYIKGLSLF